MMFKQRKKRRQQLYRNIDYYIQTVLPVRLESFKSGVGKTSKVETGANTIIRIVESDTGHRCVVRVYPQKTDKNKAKEHCEISALFLKQGVTTPEILYHDHSPETRKNFGFGVVVETFIEAKALTMETLNLRDDIRKKFVEHLTRIHGVKETISGKPWHPENERKNPISYFEYRSKLYLDRLSTHLLKLSAKEQKTYHHAFCDLMKPIKEIDEYNLIHGDLQPMNILLTPDDDVVFLDFCRSCYGFFEEDLVSLYVSFYIDAHEGFAILLDEYFSLAGPERLDRYRKCYPFFRSFYHLEKASSSVIKHRKIMENRKQSAQPDADTKFLIIRAERHWERFVIGIQQPTSSIKGGTL